MYKTDELRTARIDSLITPQQLAEKLPISEVIADNVTASRKRIEKILIGEDPRLLVVIGPALFTTLMRQLIMPPGSMCYENAIKTGWKS